jgi:hypothetical protein
MLRLFEDASTKRKQLELHGPRHLFVPSRCNLQTWTTRVSPSKTRHPSGTYVREDPSSEVARCFQCAAKPAPRETLTDPFRGRSRPSVHHSPPWLELPSSRKNPIIVIPWTRRRALPSAAAVAGLGLITVGGACCTNNATARSACSRVCR